MGDFIHIPAVPGSQHSNPSVQRGDRGYGNNSRHPGGGRARGRGRGYFENNHSRGQGRGRGRGRDRGRGRGRGWGRGGSRFQGGGRGGMPKDYDISKDRIEHLGEATDTSLNIAIEGCCHGELDPIYERLLAYEKENGKKVDLLICCGDFQSFRNPADFHSCSMPPKYRRLGSFPLYYSGEKKAPILTLFIGGNHEASQPLRELYYGGWAAPNIYYLGAAGAVRFGGVRIAGLSSIYKSHDYQMGHYESPPFDNSTLRSVYHVRNVDIYRMKCLSKGKSRVDIIASHDWPLGIEQHGNTGELLRKKPYFRAEVQRNDLGSAPNREVLDVVKPRWWFAAHLHVKFLATVNHKLLQESEQKQTDEGSTKQLIPSQVSAQVVHREGKKSIEIAEGDKVDPTHNQVAAFKNENTGTQTNFHGLESSCKSSFDLTELMTQFLALDKCLPRRNYLSIVHLETGESREDACLEYDLDWLAVLRKTHLLNSATKRRVEVPDGLVDISDDDIQQVKDLLKLNLSMVSKDGVPHFPIPLNFQPTVPFYSNSVFQSTRFCCPLPVMGNPQTDSLLAMLGLDHILTKPYQEDLTIEKIANLLAGKRTKFVPEDTNAPSGIDENEIDIDGDDMNDDNVLTDKGEKEQRQYLDDNEIDLEDEVEEDRSPKAKSQEGLLDDEASTTKIPSKKARLDENNITNNL